MLCNSDEKMMHFKTHLDQILNEYIRTWKIKQPHTFFSSTTGAEDFGVAGSSGGNPSLLLLSACEDIISVTKL